ncbi:hypothetical protein BDP27DRAFT_1332787 [Rhodocollybia butyracea]|uniref:Uncharacterized protein n=1 Tax=Rhodocollybia butyracea TaxID=206335 RepID=A0A9P5PN24_9AGAR|nr:hypothetical protein BDP27DRAFT_1332787 [Rhodocollybia butyracea]
MDNSPFYAYITSTSPTLRLMPSRSLMVFSNSSVADEWWRFVSAAPTSGSGSTNFSSYLAYLLADEGFTITRTSAQLYMCISKYGANDLIYSIFQLTPICDKFEGKFFVGQTSSIVLSTTLTEHISGNWYYIRAKHDHNLYWMDHLSQDITITTAPVPTAFKIVGIDVPEGTVLIGSDKIKLLLRGQRGRGGERFLSDYVDPYDQWKRLVIAEEGEPAVITGLEYDWISYELVNACGPR